MSGLVFGFPPLSRLFCRPNFQLSSPLVHNPLQPSSSPAWTHLSLPSLWPTSNSWPNNVVETHKVTRRWARNRSLQRIRSDGWGMVYLIKTTAKFISRNQRRTRFPIGTNAPWLVPHKFHQIHLLSTQTKIFLVETTFVWTIQHLHAVNICQVHAVNICQHKHCLLSRCTTKERSRWREGWSKFTKKFGEAQSEVTTCLHCTHCQLSRFCVTHNIQTSGGATISRIFLHPGHHHHHSANWTTICFLTSSSTWWPHQRKLYL